MYTKFIKTIPFCFVNHMNMDKKKRKVNKSTFQKMY